MPPQQEDNILPSDFDGVFRFTNWTDKEFVGTWNKIQYKFPPMSTSPMVIRGATPEDVQHIRKKFAKELAIREFYSSDKFKMMDAEAPAGSGKVPGIYTDADIASFVQKALDPLPTAFATAKSLPADKDTNYHTDHTVVLGQDDLDARKSLAPNGSEVLAG